MNDNQNRGGGAAQRRKRRRNKAKNNANANDGNQNPNQNPNQRGRGANNNNQNRNQRGRGRGRGGRGGRGRGAPQNQPRAINNNDAPNNVIRGGRGGARGRGGGRGRGRGTVPSFAKPTIKYTAGCWQCKLCGHINQKGKKLCFEVNCNGTKITNGMVFTEEEAKQATQKLTVHTTSKYNTIKEKKKSEQLLRNKPNWICSMCLTENLPIKIKCIRCETSIKAERFEKIEFAKGSFALIKPGGVVDENYIDLNRQRIDTYLYIYWYCKSVAWCQIVFYEVNQAKIACELLNKTRWNESSVRDQIFRENIFEKNLKGKLVESYVPKNNSNALNIDSIPLHFWKQDISKQLADSGVNTSNVRYVNINSMHSDHEWKSVQEYITKNGSEGLITIKPAGGSLFSKKSRYKSCTVEYNSLAEAHNICTKLNEKTVRCGNNNKLGNVQIVLKVQMDLIGRIRMYDEDAFNLLLPDLNKLKLELQRSRFGYDIRIMIPNAFHPHNKQKKMNFLGRLGKGKKVEKKKDFVEITLFAKTSEALVVSRKSFERLCEPLIIGFNDICEYELGKKLIFKYYNKLKVNQPEYENILIKENENKSIFKLYFYGIPQMIDILNIEINKIKNVIKRISIPCRIQFIRKIDKLLPDNKWEAFTKTYCVNYNVFVMRAFNTKTIDIIYTDIITNKKHETKDDNEEDIITVNMDALNAICDDFIECKDDKNNKLWYNTKTFVVTFKDPKINDPSKIKGNDCATLIRDKVLEFDNKKAEEKKGDDSKENEICGICFMDIEPEEDTFFELRICGHLFHSDCYEMQIQSQCIPVTGKRPIKCAKCAKLVSLLDISKALNNEQYKVFLKNVVNDYVKLNGERYRNCPSADCQQIIDQNWNTWKADDIDDDTIGDKHIFNCSECAKIYCLECKDKSNTPTIYHFGKECKNMVDGVMSEDKEFAKFYAKFLKSKDVKQCPHCKLSGDKIKGSCNRAVCAHCGSMFCWVCRWYDPKDRKNSTPVYSHLTAVHGGFW
eukprot:527566_1